MDLEQLVAKHEAKIEQQEKDIDMLRRRTEQLHYDLSELKTLLMNIKYWLYGIGTFYITSEVGLTEAIKKYFGIG